MEEGTWDYFPCVPYLIHLQTNATHTLTRREKREREDERKKRKREEERGRRKERRGRKRELEELTSN